MTFDNWNGHSHCTTKLSPTSPQLLIFWKISKFIRFGRASYTICSKTSRWNKQEMQKNYLMAAMPFDNVWMLQCPQPMYESVPTSRDVFFHKLVSSSSNQIELLLWVFDALYQCTYLIQLSLFRSETWDASPHYYFDSLKITGVMKNIGLIWMEIRYDSSENISI